MKIIKNTFFLILFTFGIHAFSVQAAQAATLELSPSSGQIQSTGSSIEVKVNSGGKYLKSTTAVVTYDQTKANITITEGSFFSNVTYDTSKAGEVVITGTLNIGDTVGVTGTGTLAQINITPIIDNGQLDLTFRCSESQVDDSNIIDMDDQNLLATTAQCGNNVSGGYTIGGGTTADATPAAQTTTQQLPQAGSNDATLFILGGLFFIITAIWTTWSFNNAKDFND